MSSSSPPSSTHFNEMPRSWKWNGRPSHKCNHQKIKLCNFVGASSTPHHSRDSIIIKHNDDIIYNVLNPYCYCTRSKGRTAAQHNAIWNVKFEEERRNENETKRNERRTSSCVPELSHLFMHAPNADDFFDISPVDGGCGIRRIAVNDPSQANPVSECTIWRNERREREKKSIFTTRQTLKNRRSRHAMQERQNWNKTENVGRQPTEDWFGGQSNAIWKWNFEVHSVCVARTTNLLPPCFV